MKTAISRMPDVVDTYDTYDTYRAYDVYGTYDTYDTYDTHRAYDVHNTYDTYNTCCAYDTYDTRRAYCAYGAHSTYGTYHTYREYNVHNAPDTYRAYDTYDTRRAYRALDTFRIMPCIMFLSLLAASVCAERHIVTAPITIEAGDTLRIAPGAEYLFAEYTGITVNGHLQAVGTKERPVAFVSTADTGEGGTPFDWNGIEVTGGGSADIAYCLIANATSGITADSGRGLNITECIFTNNGQWHLSVGGEIQAVADGKPYSYGRTAAVIPTPEILAVAVSADTIPALSAGNRPGVHRRGWRNVLIGAGAAAVIGGGAAFYNAHTAHREYNAYVPGNGGFDAAAPDERQRHFDNLRGSHGAAQFIGWTLLGLAAADMIYLQFFF